MRNSARELAGSDSPHFLRGIAILREREKTRTRRATSIVRAKTSSSSRRGVTSETVPRALRHIRPFPQLELKCNQGNPSVLTAQKRKKLTDRHQRLVFNKGKTRCCCSHISIPLPPYPSPQYYQPFEAICPIATLKCGFCR
ncbi:hypothetical protein I7I48_12035 [Histoplasma ohiense]|nr:hypothetical protein I7I48_12035 [Histoplasma ohiense (nom. inval.)]